MNFILALVQYLHMVTSLHMLDFNFVLAIPQKMEWAAFKAYCSKCTK